MTFQTFSVSLRRPTAETDAHRGAAVPEMCRSGWVGHIYKERRLSDALFFDSSKSRKLQTQSKTKQQWTFTGCSMTAFTIPFYIIRYVRWRVTLSHMALQVEDGKKASQHKRPMCVLSSLSDILD